MIVPSEDCRPRVPRPGSNEEDGGACFWSFVHDDHHLATRHANFDAP
jgi:hypothetical protein